MTVFRLGLRFILAAILIFLMVGLQIPTEVNALPAGFQEFFIPLPTGNNTANQPYTGTYSIFNRMNTTSIGNGMHYVVGVAASADNTKVYYDQWENGLGTGTNADEVVSLNKGQTWKFESSNIPVPRGTSTKYDGGDRIFVSGSLLQLVVSTWTETEGTVFTDSWEVYPVKAWDKTYTIPVGEDLASAAPSYGDFKYVFALIISGNDSNNVVISDPKGPPAYPSPPSGPPYVTNTTLNRGQTYIYEVKGAGTTITASAGVMVQMMTGTSTDWEMRGYTITPRSYWSTGYYTPVPSWSSSGSPKSNLFIYNPNSSNITINYEDLSGTGNFTVVAGKTKSYFDGTGRYVPLNSGAYIYNTSGNVFWAIGAGDDGDSLYDWGYDLIPINFLGTDNYVSWAPGNRTMTSGTVNGSPVYVTALSNNTTVFVDYGKPDLSNPTLSAVNDGVIDATFHINRLQSIKIFDPDKDNTGMHILSTAPVAIAWGEDPEVASAGDPYLDMGYTTLPLPIEWIDIALQVQKTASPTEVYINQESTFTIVVSVPDTAGASVNGTTLVDHMPPGWSYVTGSGTPSDPVTINGTVAGGLTLNWLVGNISPGGSKTYTFRGLATSAADLLNPNLNSAAATGQALGTTLTADDQAFVHVLLGVGSIDIAKSYAWTTGNGTQVGNEVTYAFTVTNTGNVTLTGVTANDTQLGPITLGSTSLAPGVSTNGTKILTLTQALLDAGSETNIVTATGTPPTGSPVTDNATQTVTFITTPAIHVAKTFAWTTGNGAQVGDIVTYNYTVTNVGNQTLQSVTANDSKLGPITLGSATLAPGASTNGTATLTLTQVLLDAGSTTNIVTANGTSPTGTPVADTDSQTVTFTQVPSIDIQKAYTWTTGNGTQVGNVVTFTFAVTNTGNVNLSSVTANDSKLGPITLGSASLAPGASTNGTATLTLTQALLDAGSETNIVTANGTSPNSTKVTDNTTQTVTFITTPAVHVAKTFAWTTGNGAQAGDIVTYSYTVTNEGNLTLHSVTANDTPLGPITLGSATLAPGASTNGTAALTLTQGLLDAGSATNIVIAAGVSPTGSTVTDNDSQTVTFNQSASIDIAKTYAWTTGDGSQVGNVVTYTFSVTNNSNVTLTGVTANDTQLGAITLGSTSLAPGVSTNGTKTLTLTQALLDAGSETNIVTATGTPPTGSPVTDNATQTVTFITTPAIHIAKTFAWTTGNGAQVGDIVTYNYTVTNMGNLTLHSMTANDTPLGPITLSSTTLVPGASTNGSLTLTLTEPLLDAGSQTNTVIAAGISPTGSTVTDNDSQTVTFTQVPSIDIQKAYAWTTGDGSQVGNVVTFTFAVTNTGNVDLSSVTANDTTFGLITLGSNFLEPGVSTNGTATLTLTQALLDAGSETNIVTANGTSPNSTKVTDNTTQTVTFITTPAIHVAKTFAWTTGNGAQVGDIVTYTYTVTNMGNLTLHSVTANDTPLGPITLGSTILTPGASTNGTLTLTMTQGLLDAGLTINTVIVGGVSPSGLPVTDTDSQTVTFLQEPEIDIIKTYAWTSGDGSHVGNVVTYTYMVTNMGNVTLNPVTANDTPLGYITLGSTSLAPGVTTNGTATLTLTQGLLDAGSATNIVIATGKPPIGADVTGNATQTVSFIFTPSLSVSKNGTVDKTMVSPANQVNPGDKINYTFTVTNNGTITLNNITVSDLPALTQGPLPASVDSLAPGASTSFSGNYTLTQADIDTGRVDDVATATGTPAIGPPVTGNGTATVPLTEVVSLSVSKNGTVDKTVVSPANQVNPGDKINYTFTVTNNGTVTLNNITVSDLPALTQGPLPSSVASLSPGASASFSGNYTLTQADIDAGRVDDIATATGTPPTGPPVTGNGTATVTLSQVPSLSIVKTGILNMDVVPPNNQADIGDRITYIFTVTNNGTVTLTGVTVTDPKIIVAGGPISLAVGASDNTTFTGNYTLQQSDINTGRVDNTAVVSSNQSVSANGTAQNILREIPSLSIVKKGVLHMNVIPPYDQANAGDTITYSFTVTNNGTVPLTGITVTDPMIIVTGGPISLAVGASDNTTFTGTYTLLQSDINAGRVDNIATVHSIESVSANGTSQITIQGVPSLAIVKTGTLHLEVVPPNSQANAGDVIIYHFTVINTGNLPLTGVTVTDPKITVTGGPISLPVGFSDSATFTGNYTLQQSDITAGKVDNVATVHSNESSPATGNTTTELPLILVPGVTNLGIGATIAIFGGLIMSLVIRRRKQQPSSR